MSLQDDIFDVRASLEDAYGAQGVVEQFDDICEALGRFERERDAVMAVLRRIQEGREALKFILDVDLTP